jgi:hypothetical protein
VAPEKRFSGPVPSRLLCNTMRHADIVIGVAGYNNAPAGMSAADAKWFACPGREQGRRRSAEAGCRATAQLALSRRAGGQGGGAGRLS